MLLQPRRYCMAGKLLIYKSAYGGTKAIVDMALEKMDADVTARSLEEVTEREIEEADRIAVGSAIHAGALDQAVKQFLEDHTETLTGKPLALFICCMQREYAEEYFLREFPHELTGAADLRLCLGGDVDPDRLGFFARLSVKRTTGSDKRRQWHDERAMEKLAAFMRGAAAL
jgi:menaquinone-dependent protoporphyrinogen oxidase